MGTSAIWLSSLFSANRLPSRIGMSDEGARIIAEVDQLLLEFVHKVMGQGEAEECCPMAELLLVCIGPPGDCGFIYVGVSGHANPTRQLASLSR